MSSILDKKLSILERKPVSYRMRARDEAGKHLKKRKKTFEHFNKNWDKDLWEQIGQHCLSGSMDYQLS